jgi:hypothetical protein
MCTDPALDLLTKGNCANVCLHRRCWCRWLPASWLQSFVFECFSSQHFTCLIVITISRHWHGTLRVSWKANFCVFSRDLFRDSRRNELIEAWRVARLLPLTGHTRCGSRARVGGYLVGRLADMEGSLPCRRDVRPVSGNMTSSGSKRRPFFPRNYTRGMISQPMTGKSHFQEVYRW